MDFRNENGVLIARRNGETLRIEAWGKDSLRVRATMFSKFTGNNWALTEAFEKGNPVVEITGEEVGEPLASITNGRVRATVNFAGVITFYRDGEQILQEYYLIALDVFRKFPYPKDKDELTAWLSLLVTENLEEAERLIQDYPWLQEIYEEIAMLRHRPEEVLGMFSEALRILDQNTVKYMIEELQKQLEDTE